MRKPTLLCSCLMVVLSACDNSRTTEPATSTSPASGPRMDIIPGSGPGRIVVSHDEWILSNEAFECESKTGQFALNLARWFTGGGTGNFLAYSDNFGLTGDSLASNMASAGHSWTVNTGLDFTLTNLLQYDAIYLAARAADNSTLIDYVNAGGNVYLAAGTGVPNAPGEASQWSTFLNAFNLNLASTYNNLSESCPPTNYPIASGHPIFTGVDYLFVDNGQSVNEVDPSDPRTRILESVYGNGLYAVFNESYEPTANPGGPYTGDEGSPVVFDGSSSSDPDGDALTYVWDFGDPNDPTPGSGEAPTHTYADNGEYQVTLTVSDDGGLSDMVSATVTIVNVAPSVDAGPDATIRVRETLNLAASFSDPGANDAPWSWEIDWGDGSPTETGSSDDQSLPARSYTYQNPGQYTVTVTVTDKDGDSGSDDVIVTVRDNQAPVANTTAGEPYTGVEGSEIAFDGSRSIDPDGDEIYYDWNFGDNSPHGSGATPTHIYADNDVFQVELVVRDVFGVLSNPGVTTATISNVAPTVSTGPGATIYSGESFGLTATFADPGLNDDPWDFTINWGVAEGGQPQTEGGTTDDQAAEITGTHRYYDAAVRTTGSRDYPVVVTVADKDGGQGSAGLVVTVSPFPLEIDIQPGDPNNRVVCNLPTDPVLVEYGRADYKVKVAVLTTPSFDATLLHPTRLTFEGAHDFHEGRRTTTASTWDDHYWDVDADGDTDLVVDFSLADTGLSCASASGTLIGRANDHRDVRGTDAVMMFPLPSRP
jgi:PKD repeat protein